MITGANYLTASRRGSCVAGHPSRPPSTRRTTSDSTRSSARSQGQEGFASEPSPTPTPPWHTQTRGVLRCPLYTSAVRGTFPEFLMISKRSERDPNCHAASCEIGRGRLRHGTRDSGSVFRATAKVVRKEGGSARAELIMATLFDDVRATADELNVHSRSPPSSLQRDLNYWTELNYGSEARF